MALEVKMPKLGMTMEVGKIVEWMKKDGDSVEKGDVILVIESDKVTYEVEAPVPGFLVILVKDGENIPVGTCLGYLAETREECGSLKETKTTIEQDIKSGKTETEPAHLEMPAKSDQPVRATPGARKLAKEKGVDLSAVRGSGPQGRIEMDDIINVSREKTPEKTQEREDKASMPPPVQQRAYRDEAMTSMRATISRRMMESLHQSAQMTAFAETDVTELMKLRELINKTWEPKGRRVSIPGLMVYILGKVLKEWPIFNSTVLENRIRYWENVNVGLAIAVDDGLVVPVVKGVEKMSLADIQTVLDGFIERARGKKLLPDEMREGSFTLTNIGSYGSEYETIILNPPEVGILAIGKISKKAVVLSDEIVIRQIMPISLTYDHRIIDGATAGAFRNRLIELIERPNPALLIA